MSDKENLHKLDIRMDQLNSKIETSKVELIKCFVGLFLILGMMIIGLYFKK